MTLPEPDRLARGEALVSAAIRIRDDHPAPAALAHLFRALADYLAAEGPMSVPWRSARVEAGLSLREVARRTDINPGRLSILERGVTPTPAEAELLQAAIDAGPALEPA